MINIEEMNKWKDYDIRYEFKNAGGKQTDVQMLCFMDDKLAYASKKNCFKRRTIKTHELKTGKWMIPHYEEVFKDVLIWSNRREHERFLNFCKRFKFTTCMNLQDELKIKQCNYKD